MKNRCAPAYCWFPFEKSRMTRSTFCEVDIRRYIASNWGCGSRWEVIDSMTAGVCTRARARIRGIVGWMDCQDGSYVQRACISYRNIRAHTRDILLQNIKLLQHRAEEALRVLVHDEDLPSPRWVHGADRLQKLYSRNCRTVSQMHELYRG